MATLQEITHSIAATVDRPYDTNLQEQLKHIVSYKRANYTQQFLEKHPDQRQFFLQKFTMTLEKAPKDDCDPVQGCVILRTECEVPKPLRSSKALFDFVGDSNFVNGYGKLDPAFVQDVSANRFTKVKPKWFYQNNRIYIYNTTVINRIGVRGIFEDPTSIAGCACEGEACYNDTMEYPMAFDLLNPIVRDILNVELRKLVPYPTEVQTDKIEQLLSTGINPDGRA